MANLFDVLQGLLAGRGGPAQKDPNYQGTPPFVYDPSHPYYRQNGPAQKDPNYQGTPPFVYDPSHPYYRQNNLSGDRVLAEAEGRPLLSPPPDRPSLQAEQIPLGTSVTPQPLIDGYQGSSSGYVPDGSASYGTPPPPMDRQQARLINARQNTRELSDPNDPRFRPVVNNDRGWGGRLLDIGRQFVISAGDTYGKTGSLGAAIGGGIAGGVYGGFHPEVDEERQRLYDIKRSQGLEGELEGQIARDQNRKLMDARIEDIPVDNEIRMMQVRAVKQNQALTRIGRRKYYDPNNPLHVQDAVEAGMNPDQLVAFDDRDPKTAKLGNDLFQFNRDKNVWEIAGSRGDMVDWKLGDKTYRIPADKAAYNDTMLQLGAERVAATREATALRSKIHDNEFGLAMQRFEQIKKAATDAQTRGDTKAAAEYLRQLAQMQMAVESDLDLSPSQQERLSGIIGDLTRLTPGLNQ